MLKKTRESGCRPGPGRSNDPSCSNDGEADRGEEPGDKFLGALHAVYPDIPLCPTGGVSTANMLEYFKSGAAVVGVGNNVIDQKALAAGDRGRVIEHALGFLELAAQARP